MRSINYYMMRPAIYFMPTDLFPGEVFLHVDDRVLQGIMPHYLISNYGRLYTILSNRYKSLHENRKGYLLAHVMYYRDGKYYDTSLMIHRIEMMMFKYFPGCESYQIDHIDCNKHNNIISLFPSDGLKTNLEWVTCKENMIRASQNSLRDNVHGLRNKLGKDLVEMICKEFESNPNYNMQEMADRYNVTYDTISNIHSRKHWSSVSKDFNF